MAFIGFIELETSLIGTIIAKQQDQPADADAAPTYRIYGPDSDKPMANGSGTSQFLDTGTITGATNASPIVITSATHGLTTGARINVSGVVGNTAANGNWTVTRIDANTFSLQGSTGNGAYVSGGTWHVQGLYKYTHSIAGADGYEAGKEYTVIVNGNIGSVPVTGDDKFIVV